MRLGLRWAPRGRAARPRAQAAPCTHSPPSGLSRSPQRFRGLGTLLVPRTPLRGGQTLWVSPTGSRSWRGVGEGLKAWWLTEETLQTSSSLQLHHLHLQFFSWRYLWLFPCCFPCPTEYCMCYGSPRTDSLKKADSLQAFLELLNGTSPLPWHDSLCAFTTDCICRHIWV